ncbi:hypothetical protein BJV82DRAFT_525188 [Fennellomyces sp. T-0311]|nr:hypothetical protein BJV82DRAFT_525188 [Fennellomyces sp. T-0311]
MKTRVKLYTHRIKSAANGRLYDVFEIRTPYTTPRSIQQNQKRTDAAAISRAFDIASTKQAYAPSYKEACMFLRAIQVNRRERLSPQCLRKCHLATFVVQAWEVNPTETKVTELVDVMKHLLDTTRIDTADLDEALKQSCRNPAAFPTVCPSVALLVAMRYIDRLKKKYNNIRGAMGCSHRLVVVAYMMATKYIHANLRLIIDVTEPRRRSSVDTLVFSRLSTERSTLKKSPSPMVSPPASPKSESECAQSPPEQQATSKSQRALRALRMEIEFLHFLNYDLTLSDPVGLVEWAHRLTRPAEDQEPPAPYYSSADEGDDEMDSDDASSLG